MASKISKKSLLALAAVACLLLFQQAAGIAIWILLASLTLWMEDPRKQEGNGKEACLFLQYH